MTIRFLLPLILTSLASACSSASAETPIACREASDAIAGLVAGAALREARAALTSEIGALPVAGWAPGYCRAVADNFARKLVSRREGVSFDANSIIRTAVKYEAFRTSTFRNSGVAPKLYFGFFDGCGATRKYEQELLRVADRAATILNAYADKNGIAARVTAKEIVVTQMAEGGALLLTTRFPEVDKVHPVLGVGLDDYRIGFQRFPGLTAELDAAFGAHLGALNGAHDDVMSFTETVLGTAVMYLYEKDLAEQKLLAEKRPSLKKLPLDEQFIVASLVYNSGILFADERVKQILSFDTAAYLADISERSAPKRPRLPVMTREAADAWLAEGKAPPDQNTSWNAVYHVLQRYGAWVALDKFSGAFAQDGSVKAAL